MVAGRLDGPCQDVSLISEIDLSLHADAEPNFGSLYYGHSEVHQARNEIKSIPMT